MSASGLPAKGSIKVIAGKETPGTANPGMAKDTMKGGINNLAHSLSGTSANQKGGASSR